MVSRHNGYDGISWSLLSSDYKSATYNTHWGGLFNHILSRNVVIISKILFGKTVQRYCIYIPCIKHSSCQFLGGDIPVRCKTARNTQVVRILCASRCSSAFARFECQKSCSESCISKKLEFLNMTGDCGSQNPQFRLSPCLIFRPLPNFTQTPPVNGDCVEKVYQNYMPQF